MAGKQFAHPREALNHHVSKGEPIVSLERYYICMVPHYWGRGRTIEEAKKATRKAGADAINKKDGYLIHAFNVPGDTSKEHLPRVNGYGMTETWPGTTRVYSELVRNGDGKVLEGAKDSRIDNG